MYTVTLPTFEGPLDLLLLLIEQAELDITTIALAQVADQYLQHVQAMDTPDLRSLAEFVSVAARLVLIKSRVLLPRHALTEEKSAARADADARVLIQQLREYQRYKKAAALLRTWEHGRQMFVREAVPSVAITPHYPPLEHTLADLAAAAQRRRPPAPPAPRPAARLALVPRLTIADVMHRIDEQLATRRACLLAELLLLTTTRQEVVVTFWAVLELLKLRRIRAQQAALFGPVRIEQSGTDYGHHNA